MGGKDTTMPWEFRSYAGVEIGMDNPSFSQKEKQRKGLAGYVCIVQWGFWFSFLKFSFSFLQFASNIVATLHSWHLSKHTTGSYSLFTADKKSWPFLLPNNCRWGPTVDFEFIFFFKKIDIYNIPIQTWRMSISIGLSPNKSKRRLMSPRLNRRSELKR